jgi:hypothetical protein
MDFYGTQKFISVYKRPPLVAYPETDESSPVHTTLFLKIHFSIIPSCDI